ncbi:MAG: S-layer homology domain-containing protein, partial [Clostridia bacterium]|nr:S-layer homology domain-containing protein [Clostridia bacterium]
YGSGTYQFTVQALGDGETTADSDVVTSEPWEFTAASTKLTTPETAWSSEDSLTATWTSSTEDLAGGYQIRMYYSPDNANATSTADLDVVSRFVYYTALDGEQTAFGYDPEDEAGYYYFQVRAISSDESQVRHSAWSGLSTAYAYGVSSDGDGDTGSGGSGDTTNAVPVISDVNWSNGYLRIECDYAEDADTSLVDSLTVDISTNGTDWVSFGDNWSSETKSIDVAYSAIRYNVPAGAYKKIRFTSEAVSGYSDAYAVFDMDLTITRSEVGTLSAAFAAEDTENFYTVTVDLGDQSAKLDENGLCNGVIYTYSEDRYQDYGMDTGTVYFSYYDLDETGTTVTVENEFLRNPYWYIMYLLEETISADDQSLTTPKTVALTDLAGWKECFPACDHDWDDGEITTDPTCSAEGVKTFTCLLCSTTKTESIPATGEHSWGSWNTTQNATCTAAGSETRACGTCSATETRSTSKLNHNYEAAVTAPTCTDQGYTTHTCSLCGDSYKDTYVDALQHDWDEGVITTEPTEDADGVKTYTCQRSGCGETKTEVVSKLAKQEVSWFPAGPITWTYGQVVSAQNTAYNDTEDGGALTYSSSDESVATVDANGKATIVGAGTCEIIATAARVPGKYAETSASYTLVINKAPLTVTANNASITYGQAPANDGWTASDFVCDDTTADVTGTAAYTYGYEQFGNVGTYAINVSGLTANNYEITYAPGALTVNKAAEYTITLGNLSQRDDAVTAVTAVIAPQDSTAQIEVEYQVNGTWTSAVPTEAGEYPVRAALTSSDNIAVTGAYTNGTLVIERSIVVDNTDVSVTVDGEKAEIVVTDEELTEIVDNVDGEVAIDLSGVTDVTELTLPGNLMDALSQSDKADSLTVTTGDSSISMSSAVLDTVAKEVTGEDSVTVKLTSVAEDELNADQQAALDSLSQDAVIVEVSLVITHADGSATELHELGGNVEITVPFEGEVPAGKYIAVCYLSDDGNVTYLRATYDAETKQVTFKTNHFSNYAAFVSGSPMVVVNGGSGSGLYAEGSTVTIKADSKSGYTFSGWEIVAGTVTLADASKAETTFVMPAEAVELTATYRKNSSGGGGGGSTTYSINIEDAKHGEVTADSKTFAKGETVTLTVAPDKGYTLETLTVTDKNGKEIELTKKDGKYTFTMPAGKVTVKATFMEDNSMLNFFVDVPVDAYYYEAVLWAAENGITGGTSATTFSPDMTCTRAQAVTFLWRAAGSTAPKTEVMPFADVDADDYYYDAVLWAVENGITAGTSDTTFSPDMTCSRAQIMTFLWRAQQDPTSDAENPFADVAADAYYSDAVVWAVENGITSGTSATTFSPNNNCTRAQIVTFLFRCLGGE